MKNWLFIAVLLLSFSHTNAQTENAVENEPIQTLFSKPTTLGWWVSPDFAFTQINNKTAWLGGASGGLIVNHNFSIGLGGYGIMNSNQLNFSGIIDTADVYLYGGYGGLKLEYRLFPTKVVHVAFPLLIGGGSVAYSTWNFRETNSGSPDSEDYDDYVWDSFFVVEPGVVIGVNLLEWLRFDAGYSYRYAAGIEMPKTDSNILNGFNGNFSLKFGKF